MGQEAERAARKSAFLAALAKCGIVKDSCKAAGVGTATVYKWRDTDADFAISFDGALQDACDDLEREARRRAVRGVLEPVFHQGRKVGHIRRYSDGLLALMLRAHRPQRFATRTVLTGDADSPVVIDAAQSVRSKLLPELALLGTAVSAGGDE